MAQTLTAPPASQVSPPSTSKALHIALWVVQVLVAAMFLFAGSGKLRAMPEMVANFNKIGFGIWFLYLTGGLEVLGAILLLIPRLTGVGALLLACVMVGAVATHLFILGGSPVAAIVLLLASLFIAWGRRAQTLSLLPGAR